MARLATVAVLLQALAEINPDYPNPVRECVRRWPVPEPNYWKIFELWKSTIRVRLHTLNSATRKSAAA